MYIKRKLENTIIKHLSSPEIIAVIGPRQSGKTTMIKNIINGLEKSVAVSFDDQNILALFEKNTDEFINIYIKGNKHLFIDEFQYAKNGGKILKYIFDSQKIKIIISGSSAVDLTIKAVKYLVGRVLIFELHSFDFQEFLLAKDKNYLKIYATYRNKIKPEVNKFLRSEVPSMSHQKLLRYYEEYLLYGGYPRVVLEENYETKKELLKNIYNTYFLREVRDILGLIDDYKLNNLIKGLALQTGNLIEYQELARLTGFSFSALKKYLNFLEKTYICRLVRPFYKNRRIEIVKNPKAYFIDTGLRNAIINDFRGVEERTDAGALLENGLAMGFTKNDLEFNFWRDKKKNEIDFVVFFGNGKILAVESKKYLKGVVTPAIKIFSKNYPAIKICFSYWHKDKKKLKKEVLALPIYLLG